MSLREFGVFADWKPLTDAGRRWITKWDPNFIYLGLTDEGTTKHGSARPRRAWGAKRSTWQRRIASDVAWLEQEDVEACYCVWYDFSQKTNDDLLAWFPQLIVETNVRTVSLNMEYAAKMSALRGEKDTRLFQELLEMGVRVEISAYRDPIAGIVDTIAEATPEACGLIHYMPEAYSHYPPKRKPTHWTRRADWKPGKAQALGWLKAPKGGVWGVPVMGIGCYYLEGHGPPSRVSFREMVHGSPTQMIAVWSLKHAVRRGRDWIGETLDLWRSERRG